MADVKTVWYSTVLVSLSCGKCGIPFAMPENFQTARMNDRQTFYCPNGHPRVYRQSKAEAERDEALARLRSTQECLESWRIDANHQRGMRQIEERKNRALRGVITRTKRRVAHGVCPCCQRTFRQLAEHMKSEHPDYIEAADKEREVLRG